MYSIIISMNFLRRLPIEVYILFLPSTLVLTALYLTKNSDISFFFKENILLGSATGKIAMLLLMANFAFLIGKLNLEATHLDADKRSSLINEIFFGILSGFFFCNLIIISTMAMGSSLTYLFGHSLRSEVAFFSNQMMNIDFNIFKTYPPFTLQILGKSHFIEVILIYSYASLFTLVPVFIPFSLLKKNVFRGFILSFFLSYALAWPLWYINPIIQPALMYKDNILQEQIPTAIKLAIVQNKPTNYNESVISDYDKLWIDKTGKSFSVSNNPSMHVAWGLILTWYSIMLFPYIGFIAVPWYVFNVLGTMYTMQHYGIDVINGLGLAIITIFIVEKLLHYETTYLRDEYKLLSIFNLIKKSFLNVLK